MILRPTPAITLLCAIVSMTQLDAGAVDFTWDGNGDANNGGVWSDTNNWDVAGFPANTNDTADLQATLSSDRFITNDVATAVGTIVMEDHTRHHLVLDADLFVDTIDGAHDKYLSHIHLNGQTLTAGRSIGIGAYMASLDGPGTFIKATAGTMVLNGEDEYTGSIIVSNGVLSFRTHAWDTTTLMTVLDGATAGHVGTAADLPTNILINGNGFSGNGAIHFTSIETCASRVTVNTDSKMKSSGTTTFTGDIDGSGELTLEGPGLWILAGTGVPYTNTLIITDGTVQIPGDFPNLLNVLVDAGGVLEALQSQLPNAAIVTQNGGVWNQPTSAAWTGDGDGSNWTDTANWVPPVVPTEQADLRAALTSDRYIFVASNSTVVTILLGEFIDSHANYTYHHLVLGADLTVNTINGGHDKYKTHIDINGHTLTLGQTLGAGAYTPNLEGPGLFIKDTTGTSTLNGSPDTFTGSIIVSNGTLNFRSSDWDTTILMTVHDGATAGHIGSGADLPTNILINGFGFNGAGAFNSSFTDSHASDFTVNTDSKMKTSVTTTMTGDIDGSGELTLEGPGTWIFTGTGVTYTNKLIITDGTVQATGDFPDLQNVVVDSGGILEAVPSQFPSASIVTQNGGIWNIATSATWTGNGDGTNWHDSGNWAPPIIPTDQADLRQTLSSPRTINVDSNTTVVTILMEDDTDNNLVLSADLTVDTFGNEHNIYNSRVDVNGHTFTAGTSTSPNNYFVKLDGPGTFIKETTGTCTLQTEDEFTGSIIVNNGTLKFRAAQWDTTILLTVLSGGTAQLQEPGPSFPTNILINGTGFGGAGALSFTGSDTCASDITLASDSSIERGAGTSTLAGEISGPGDLTWDAGTGVFDLDGTYNFAISGAAANNMIADDGTLNISDATLSVSGEENSGGIREFIIIDYSGAGSVTGRFGATNDLKVNWTIDYDGTEDNPGAVVLVQLPTTGSVLEFE